MSLTLKSLMQTKMVFPYWEVVYERWIMEKIARYLVTLRIIMLLTRRKHYWHRIFMANTIVALKSGRTLRKTAVRVRFLL